VIVRAKLGVIDWAMAGVIALPALGLLAFPIVALRFAAMFADMGSASLPAATRLALVPWFSIGAATLAFCVVAMYLPVFELAGKIK